VISEDLISLITGYKLNFKIYSHRKQLF